MVGGIRPRAWSQSGAGWRESAGVGRPLVATRATQRDPIEHEGGKSCHHVMTENMRQRPRLIWPETVRAEGIGRSVAEGGVAGISPPARPGPRFLRLPRVAGAANPREDAIGLLQVAAEVEHTLLVQYLYAAASASGASGAPPLNPKAKIAAVAIEEMGHLVTVQNLLLAIGNTESHHWGRDFLREASEFNPIPFVLEPLNHASLAKYVVVERPDSITDPRVRARVAALEEEARLASGLDPHRVGELYAALYWLFQPADDPFGPLALSVNDGFEPGWHLTETDFVARDRIETYATVVEEWHGFPDLIVDVVVDAQSGCDALHRVMAQGEGLAGAADSHFEEFLELMDAFEAGRLTIAQSPRTPFVAGQIRPNDPLAVELTHPYTRLWGELFNLLYAHILTSLAHALVLPRGDQARDGLREAALKGMRPVLASLTRQLQRLRVNEQDARLAGPPYGLFDDEMPADAEAFWQRHRELLTSEDDVTARIKSKAEFQTCAGTVCTIHDHVGRGALQVVSDFQARIRALFS